VNAGQKAGAGQSGAVAVRWPWQSTRRARRRSEQCEIEYTPRRKREADRLMDETAAILAEEPISNLAFALLGPRMPRRT
jgi:hypothetical protein